MHVEIKLAVTGPGEYVELAPPSEPLAESPVLGPQKLLVRDPAVAGASAICERVSTGKLDALCSSGPVGEVLGPVRSNLAPILEGQGPAPGPDEEILGPGFVIESWDPGGIYLDFGACKLMN